MIFAILLHVMPGLFYRARQTHSTLVGLRIPGALYVHVTHASKHMPRMYVLHCPAHLIMPLKNDTDYPKAALEILLFYQGAIKRKPGSGVQFNIRLPDQHA